MSKAKTKDERFLVALYELALVQGNPKHPVDRVIVAERIGLNLKAGNTICNLLLQANFIKKNGPAGIHLTPHGLNLVETLLTE